MSFILNLTKFKATPHQAYHGVKDLEEEDFVLLKSLLSFEDVGYIPTKRDTTLRAMQIAVLAVKAAECKDCVRIGGYCGNSCTGANNWFRGRALIDGPAYMIPELIKSLRSSRFDVCISFTEGEVVETVTPDSEVTRTEVFRNLGFVYF